MHVDVLIVNYRTGPLTERAAAALAGPGVHVFVRDNSGELLAPEAAPLPAVTVGDGRNVLYAPACNELYRLCDGDLVLLANPDVELTHTGLCDLVAALRTDPGAWGATPALRNPDGTAQEYYRRLPTPASMLADRLPPLRLPLAAAWRRHVYHDRSYLKDGVVEQPPGACVLLYREEPELFDEAFALFFNDVDLARRRNATGRHCRFVGSVTAHHVRGASLAADRRLDRYRVARAYDAAALAYARRHLPAVVPALRAACALRAVGYRTVEALADRGNAKPS
ncbi:MAG TPA: hypothetical protein VNE21_09180 [Mycobacteriales bacterium]|nr:hypothetical protein [Mycobacteriales bacterium]